MKRRRGALGCGVVLGLLWAAAGAGCPGLGEGRAADVGTVETVLDLLEEFPRAQVTDVLECVVRRPAVSGGVRQPALFQHPLATDRPARVRYAVSLPGLESGDLLALTFDIGLSDGIQGGKGEDGVRFAVEVDGSRRFEQDCEAMRWQPGAVDLSALAGKQITLTLITEARRTTDYDWAQWGAPRVLHLRQPTVAGAGRIRAPVGLVIARLAPRRDAVLRLSPVGAGPPLEFSLPRASPGAGDPPLIVRDYAFAGAEEIEVSWQPGDALAPGDVRVAAYPAQLRIAQAGLSRRVAVAGEDVEVGAMIENVGRGPWLDDPARLWVWFGGRPWPALGADGAGGPESPRSTGIPLLVPRLAPGQRSWVGAWQLPRAGPKPIEVKLTTADGRQLDQRSAVAQVYTRRWRGEVQNPYMRLRFFWGPGEPGFASVQSLRTRSEVRLGATLPLGRVVLSSKEGPRVWDLPFSRWEPEAGTGTPPRAGQLRAEGVEDPDGVRWDATVRVELDPERPLARLRYTWAPRQRRAVLQLVGPDLYVGDGTTGDARSSALFPGLEYLFGNESSGSPRDLAPPLNDRRTPGPNKLTMPLMAVTVGEDSLRAVENPDRFYSPDSTLGAAAAGRFLVGTHAPSWPLALAAPERLAVFALFWDPFQRWDGQAAFPSPRFASPNFAEAQRNHRLGLFLPSVPDRVNENGDFADPPLVIEAGQSLRLEATLVASAEPLLAAVREWLRDRGGLPEPGTWPRPFQAVLALCREGFLNTVWDQRTERWRHCIDFEPGHAPGFAALLWMDAQVAEDGEGRRRSRERVNLAVRNMLRDGGPASLTSQAGCHLMQWELPFLCGYLPEALEGLERQMQGLLRSQGPEGGWVYAPANEAQADLGRAGDSVLGTSAMPAATLLRFARITGDTNTLVAGERALGFLEGFRIPRGAQTWECPMYEPDLLAAAYAVRAYVDGYRATGNPRWLHDAVYWAETGVPFVYLWTLPVRPAMLGATIPVFGSTFYTHSWLGLPVQWCGLVYAYHVQALAEALEGDPLPRTESPLPLALAFTPADWRRIAELITVSGLHQQFADGPRIGTYPDSLTDFTKPNPAFLNPEDLLANVLALRGHRPDVRTVRLVSSRGRLVISSAARIEEPAATDRRLRFRLRFVAGESSHTLVAGPMPDEVRVDGRVLPRSNEPVRSEPGWWWDGRTGRSYLVVRHERAEATIEWDY